MGQEWALVLEQGLLGWVALVVEVVDLGVLVDLEVGWGMAVEREKVEVAVGMDN